VGWARSATGDDARDEAADGVAGDDVDRHGQDQADDAAEDRRAR
jgi:hypothetical protein